MLCRGHPSKCSVRSEDGDCVAKHRQRTLSGRLNGIFNPHHSSLFLPSLCLHLSVSRSFCLSFCLSVCLSLIVSTSPYLLLFFLVFFRDLLAPLLATCNVYFLFPILLFSSFKPCVLRYKNPLAEK